MQLIPMFKRILKPGAGCSCCNPSYLGGWDREDCDLWPTQENSLQDLIFKITRAKWTGGVAQVAKYLLFKCKTKFKPQFHQEKKIIHTHTHTHTHTHIYTHFNTNFK
jgi:hypothetical protein